MGFGHGQQSRSVGRRPVCSTSSFAQAIDALPELHGEPNEPVESGNPADVFPHAEGRIADVKPCILSTGELSTSPWRIAKLFSGPYLFGYQESLCDIEKI